MKYRFILLFLLISIVVPAQEIMLKQSTEGLYEKKKFGANRKHFLYPYFGFGFYVPGEAGNALKPWSTNSFKFGLRYKLKFTNVVSTGMDLHYNLLNYRFNEDTRIIEDNRFFNKEKLIVQGLGPEYYLRFNFDEDRGNYVGNYLDIGIYADWLVGSEYKVFDNSGSNLFKKEERIYKNLKRLNDFSYGLTVRMAKNKYVLFVDYRLSRLFDEKYNYIELPKAQVGVIIGLHN